MGSHSVLVFSVLLISSIIFVSGFNASFADEVIATSTGFEDSTILELKNNRGNTASIDTVRIWLSGENEFKSFKEFTSLASDQEIPGKGLGITALVLAILSLGFLPILFGPLGVLLGSLSWRQGNRYGLYATIAAVVCSYLGMIIGVLVWSAV